MSGDVVVVGAGVVGASVAYHLARAGAAVCLLDAGPPGTGVTAGSFAWVGSAGFRTGPAAMLRRSAVGEYHRLESELDGLPVAWSGSLSWRTGEERPEAGPGQEVVDGATAATIEPNLRNPPARALWAVGDGSVDPVGVTGRLVEEVLALGGVVLPGTSVVAVRRDASGHVDGVQTAGGPVAGATVVLAAGVGTAALAGSVGVRVPVEPSPATLFRFRSPAGLVRTVVNTEAFDLRQPADGGLVAAADSGERTLAAIRSTFRGAEGVTLSDVRRGARPMPLDGEPIVGAVAAVPGLYVATMHAAVTLAPAVGRLVAREIVDGTREPLLAGCRPDRF